MTESYDVESRQSYIDTRKTKVKKFARNSEIDRELEKAMRTGRKHGRHKTPILGRQDQTSIPPGLAQKIMPLPHVCVHCGKVTVAFSMRCVLCGWPTPIGLVNWRR